MCLHSLIPCVNAEARRAVVSLLPERTRYVLSFLNSSTLFSASELQACCILLPVIRFASVLLLSLRPKTAVEQRLVAHDPSKTFPLQKLQPRLRSCRSLLLFLQLPADGSHSHIPKDVCPSFRALTPLGESVSSCARFQVHSDRFFHGLLDTDLNAVSSPRACPKSSLGTNELAPNPTRPASRSPRR